MWRAPLLMHVPSNAAQAIPVLMFWEVRRKDFLETFAHHCVTLTLIAYSYSLKCAAKRSDVSGAQQQEKCPQLHAISSVTVGYYQSYGSQMCARALYHLRVMRCHAV